MLNCSIRLLYSTKKQIGTHSVYYKLCEFSDLDGKEYIFCVKYKSKVSRCMLACSTRPEAISRFSALVRCRTTPLSLYDTFYEMCK